MGRPFLTHQNFVLHFFFFFLQTFHSLAQVFSLFPLLTFFFNRWVFFFGGKKYNWILKFSFMARNLLSIPSIVVAFESSFSIRGKNFTLSRLSFTRNCRSFDLRLKLYP